MTGKLAAICVEFHKELAENMLEIARKETDIADVFWVPGSLEIPLLLQHLMEKKEYAGFILLGLIEKGETLHGEVMGHAVFSKVLDLELKHKIPVGLGIIGPGATPEQAHVRVESAAKKAAHAVKSVLELLK